MATEMEQVKSLKLGDYVVKGANGDHVVEGVSNADNSIQVVGTNPTTPQVKVKIKDAADNGLKLDDTANGGLYVNKESLGLSSAYVFRGSIYPAEADAKFASGQDGWVYNIKQNGKIYIYGGGTGAQMDVAEGDNIAIVEEDEDSDSSTPSVKKWDKLSSTVKVETYTGDGVIDINSSNQVSLRIGAGLESKTDTSVSPNVDRLAVKVDGESVKLDASSKVAVNVKDTGGLAVDTTTTGHHGLEVKLNGKSLAKSADGLKVNVNATGGLEDDATNGLQVKTGGGLQKDNSDGTISVSPDNETIQIYSSKVAAKLDGSGGLTKSSNGMAVNAGTGITVGGTVSAKCNESAGVTADGSGIAVKPGSNVGFVGGDGNDAGNVVVVIDKTTAITNNTTIGDLITALGGTIRS